MRPLKWLPKKVTAHPWCTLLVLTLALWLFPQTYRIIRIFFIISVPTLWASGVFLVRKRTSLAMVLLSAGIVLLAFLCLPGSEPNRSELQEAYVNALKRYEGTLYVWGGENRIGIDCSGLVRNGLIDANARLGLRTFNPKPIRKALSIWWNDCSAQALRDGYKNFTTPLFKAESINVITHSALAPGDLAVTANGAHVLAYLGDNCWTEADPGVMSVVIVATPAENPWFTVPVHIVRWTQLLEPANQDCESAR